MMIRVRPLSTPVATQALVACTGLSLLPSAAPAMVQAGIAAGTTKHQALHHRATKTGRMPQEAQATGQVPAPRTRSETSTVHRLVPHDVVTPYYGMVITQSTTLATGIYAFTDSNKQGVLRIRGSNLTLNGNGAAISGGSTFVGFGIVLDGQSSVTITNITLFGYQYGISVTNSTSVTIVSNNLSSNKKDITTSFLSINDNTQQYGGGVRFEHVGCSDRT
jgi:parallel beta-helix repeat protein